MVENSRIKRYSTISPKTFKSCYCSVFVAFSLFLFTFFTVFRVSKLPVSCSTHYVDISFHQFSIHCAASALFISSLLSMHSAVVFSRSCNNFLKTTVVVFTVVRSPVGKKRRFLIQLSIESAAVVVFI